MLQGSPGLPRAPRGSSGLLLRLHGEDPSEPADPADVDAESRDFRPLLLMCSELRALRRAGSDVAFEAAPLKGKKCVIVGCGAQGLNQGLNMRDSGCDVSYALRELLVDGAETKHTHRDSESELEVLDEQIHLLHRQY